ncbi:MAG: FG-GAP-like repeat-containing protein [Sporichthyaceae bacterium]
MGSWIWPRPTPSGTVCRWCLVLGAGDGTFTPAVPRDTAVGDTPQSVTAGDFDGDGLLDLATANTAGDSVSLVLGDGDGTFTPAVPRDTAVGDTPQSVTAGDFDGDGVLDLATANTAGNSVSLVLGDGDGTFTPAVPRDTAVGDDPVSVVAGDFDGDGVLDLATANIGGSVSMVLGDGDGTFTAAVPRDTAVGIVPQSVTAGDFDGDGVLDLATANAADSVSVVLGDGDGTFTAAVPRDTAVGDDSRSVAAGDFDGDGDLDLAAASLGNDIVSVLVGDGSGVFTAANPRDFSVGDNPVSVIAADVDTDGDLDLATASAGTADSVSVLLNDPDATGPVVSGVAVTPNQVAVGTAAVALTATADEATTGGADIASASYTIDGGAPAALAAADGTFDEPSEALTASIATGALVPGGHQVCVTATDEFDNVGDPMCTTLTVNAGGGGSPPPPPVLVGESPPASAMVGSPYSYTFTSVAVPAPSFAVASGTLPPGLTLNSMTGVLAGTPTTAGVFTFTVSVSNTSGTDTTAPLTITVSPAAPPPPPPPPPGPQPPGDVPAPPPGVNVVVQAPGQLTTTGTAGADYIVIGCGTALGLGGDDTILYSAQLATGPTCTSGATGAAAGEGGVSMFGGPGGDTLTGGPLGDRLDGSSGDDIIRGKGGEDRITGGDGDDVVRGGGGGDRIGGGDGNDELFGGRGEDTIHGGEGRDLIGGGSGADRLFGGFGRDDISGGAGDDLLRGQGGRDDLDGGRGSDDVRQG